MRKGGFPGGSVVKNIPVNARDMGLIPGWEDFTCSKATKSCAPPQRRSFAICYSRGSPTVGA